MTDFERTRRTMARVDRFRRERTPRSDREAPVNLSGKEPKRLDQFSLLRAVRKPTPWGERKRRKTPRPGGRAA